MSRPARTLRSPLAAAGLVAVAALASLTPQRAAAHAYDIDCKLILCLPGGFPNGCGDALKHMVDRLKKGKSPIGFCALSDGTEYDSYDIDYHVVPASQPKGWQCPAGKTLYHTSQPIGGGGIGYRVNTFCYDTAYHFGWGNPPKYTNKTPPERIDFEVELTVEPGTPMVYSAGWQRFDAGIFHDPFTDVTFHE